jgi:hypothetical protein
MRAGAGADGCVSRRVRELGDIDPEESLSVAIVTRIYGWCKS